VFRVRDDRKINESAHSAMTRAMVVDALARGLGWFGNGTPDDLLPHLAGLRRAAAEVDRPARLGRLEIISRS
jgi:hypothetical protein